METSLPTPFSARVYVKLPEGNGGDKPTWAFSFSGTSPRLQTKDAACGVAGIQPDERSVFGPSTEQLKTYPLVN